MSGSQTLSGATQKADKMFSSDVRYITYHIYKVLLYENGIEWSVVKQMSYVGVKHAWKIRFLALTE